MPRFFYVRVCAALCSALALACSRGGPDKDLDIHQVLGRPPEELQERWGEPDISIRKSAQLSTLQWKDLGGVWVYVVSRDGQVCYATYTFAKMEPFAAEEAFRRMGINPPQEPPEHVWENGAKRWMPFGRYEKLTVNPKTKAISVGAREPLAPE